MIDEIAGPDTTGFIIGDAGDQLDLAVRDRSEHDGGGAEPPFQPVHGITQRLRIGIVQPGGQNVEAIDFDRLRGQIAARLAGEPRLGLLEFLLQSATPFGQLLDPALDFVRPRVDGFRDPAQTVILHLQ